jgi:hypothetical protein
MNETTDKREGRTMTNTTHKILTDAELDLVCGGRADREEVPAGSSNGNIDFNYQLPKVSSVF